MINHCVVIYDSVYNSVFHSQVIIPLVKQLNQNIFDSITIVSYERDNLCHKTIASFSPDPRIDIVPLKKIPFLGSISLSYAAWQLTPLLTKYKPQQITARGPLAASIVSHAASPHIPVLIQARGLCAHEYRYMHASSWWHRLRAWQYERVERFVYGRYAYQSHVKIEAVSEALKKYLITQWNTPQDQIALSSHDIPDPFDQKTIQKWRMQTRSKLAIPANAYVYVYSGSAHAWQCPQKTIQFFAQELRKNKNAFLLILTQNKAPFDNVLSTYNIPSHTYCVTSIPPTNIYHYLAAADAGLLFREPHLINWISRPTKVLEYYAVGLPIIHNDTVAFLTKKNDTFFKHC